MRQRLSQTKLGRREEIIGVLFSILVDELSSNEEVNPNQTLISL